jgi:hypothetical protein
VANDPAFFYSGPEVLSEVGTCPANLEIYEHISGTSVSWDESDASITRDDFRKGQDPGFGFAGDTDGDGFDDLVYEGSLFLGPLSGERDFSDSDAEVVEVEWPMVRVPTGDVNGDGYADCLGRVTDLSLYVFLGPMAGTLTGEDAAATLSFPGTGPGYIHDSTSAGDLDADGKDDIFLWLNTDSSNSTYVFVAPFEGALEAEDAAVALWGYGIGDAWMDGPADVDGDGTPDLLMGDPMHSDYFEREGVGWVVPGAGLLTGF